MLILTSEELEKDWKHNSWANHVFATHNFEASDQSHSYSRVKNGIILLQQVDKLIAKVICQFFLIHSTNMGHKLAVLIKSVVLFAWAFFEFDKLLLEYL
jgi:hypothetical protein